MRLFMKKVYMGVLFSLLLAAWALPMGAGAEEYACTASIPVRVQVYAQTDTAFTVQLEAPEGTPLPESRTLTFRGSGEGAFGPVEYTVPGDYVYTLRQTKGNAAYVTYDETVYTVTVRVTNHDKGGLVAELWAVSGESTRKTDEVLFSNRYTPPTQPPANPPQTGDSSSLTPAMAVFVAAGAALAAVAAQGRKRSQRQ